MSHLSANQRIFLLHEMRQLLCAPSARQARAYRCLVNYTLKWACGGVCLARVNEANTGIMAKSQGLAPGSLDRDGRVGGTYISPDLSLLRADNWLSLYSL